MVKQRSKMTRSTHFLQAYRSIAFFLSAYLGSKLKRSKKELEMEKVKCPKINGPNGGNGHISDGLDQNSPQDFCFNVKSLGIQLKRRQKHKKGENSLCPKFCGSVRLGFFQYTKTIAFSH